MSNLAAIAFDEALKAEEVRLELLKMEGERLIDIEDIAVVTKDDAGKLKVAHSTELTAAGTAGGGVLGAVLGALFFSPLAGAAAGASLGALAAANLGLNAAQMKRACKDLQPGGGALFVLVLESERDEVLNRLRGVGGQLIETTLSEEAEKEIQAALDDAAEPASG